MAEIYSLSPETIERLARLARVVDRMPINQLLRPHVRPPRLDSGVTMYRGEIDGALATSDTDATVDNLIFMGGANTTLKSSVTAKNVFNIAADDDAVCVIAWCESQQQWELQYAECPA